MTSQVVFLSLFLGLLAGPHIVEMQVGSAVKSVRVLLDNRPVAILQQPPWRATVDFGTSIVPSKLVAVGYDEKGNEVARAQQLVNVPRPVAEFVITLQNDDAGVPVGAQFRWEHLTAAQAVSTSLFIDGKSVPMDKSGGARLPRLDMNHPHVITGEIKFEDGFVTRREMVIGGAVTDTADAEMTPVGIRQPAAAPPENLAECFTSNGAPLRIAAVEKAPPLVVFVIDPDPQRALTVLNPQLTVGFLWAERLEARRLVMLDPGISMRILFPVAEKYQSTSNAPATLFPPTKDVDSVSAGLVWILTRAYDQYVDDKLPRRFADAVGVAGLNAITGAHRRAVVLVPSGHDDASAHSVASVRRYLASTGVPLFVWSLTGPRPDLRDTWGDVEDISSLPKLKAAADRLRADLASQRIAWVAADPITALRIQSTGRCGITPLASAK
jgi:hypothetical protein